MSRVTVRADAVSPQGIENIEAMTAVTAGDTEIPIEPYTRVHARTHTHGKGSIGKPLSPAVTLSPETLSALALRVSRLGPDRRNPEQFHEDKSEIVAELRRLARRKAVTP